MPAQSSASIYAGAAGCLVTTSAAVYTTGTSARIHVTVVDVGQPATTRPFAELPWSLAALGRRLVKQGHSSNTSKLKIPEEQYDQTQKNFPFVSSTNLELQRFSVVF